MDESDTCEVECRRKVVRGRRVAGATRSLANARGLQLECAGVLYERLLLPVIYVVRYGRGRSLRLELYRWTTSEVC